jgi:hypothetical protein
LSLYIAEISGFLDSTEKKKKKTKASLYENIISAQE